MKLLWITNIPSPYRLDFFSALGEQTELTVLFEKANSDERDESWTHYEFKNFQGILLKGISIGTDKAFAPQVIQYLKKEYDAIIVSDFLSPTGMLAIAYLKARKMPYYIESDGGFYSQNNSVITAIKRFSIKGAEGYFSTGEEHDRYYIGYGAAKDRLIRYPFSSVRERDILKHPLRVEEKKNLRTDLGIPTDKPMIVSVGQMIPRKGFDILAEAVKGLDVYTYIIGGEAPENDQAIQVRGVHCLPFKAKKEVYQWLGMADLFVLPTRYDIWGLVVNEAMACGLPVITTDRCLAGLEMVKEGINGYLVPVEDIEATRKAIITVLESDKAEEMSLNNIETARQYTIETMVCSHMKIFREKVTNKQ